jgi:glycosyltransferase involved in cell wall biosynthesis
LAGIARLFDRIERSRRLIVMRIAILLQSLDETWGGIGIYTHEIVRALLRVDSTNEYVLIYPGFGLGRTRRGQFRRYKNAIEVETEFSKVPFGTYWDQVVVPGVASRYNVDVLFNPFLTVPVRGRFGKVMIMHNVEYHVVPRVYDWVMYSWWFMLEKVIMHSADRVISISKVMTEDFRKHVKYPISQVRTIYHGVSDKFRVETDQTRLARAREEYELPEHFILFVGHIYPQKNFSTLARAFARLKDSIPHRLIVAGRPRWKADADLRLIHELGIGDRVDLLQFVPNDDLPLIYNLADCFVYPSLYESFGLAQLEAMACGCPVIGANSGAIPEITAGTAMLFDPRSPEDLANAILTVTQNATVRRDLVDRAFVRVRDFTWERTARETLAVFEELA